MDLGPGGLSSPGPSGYGGGYDATNTGGGGDNDPYQGFVRASQPRGLNKVTRTVGDGIQTAKNFFSNPVNRRGIIGSLIGSAFLGPLGLLLGGYLGKNYGGGITSAIGDKTRDTLDKFKELGNPNKYLSQVIKTPTYEPEKRRKEREGILEEFYKNNPEMRPPEEEKRTGIRDTMMAKQLTLPFDFPNVGDPFKDNYYDRDGNYVGPTVTG
tara:strand:+ start:316 stop:948 length:633 start_codon:yes stop_codon:yes gene_type:complete